MDLTYTSPIKFDFLPLIGSTVTFQFKLKASKITTKINVDTHIFYKDPCIIGKVFLANSGPQAVYTSPQDQNFSLKFKIPTFNQRTQSYINISIEVPNFQQKVVIEDMRLDSDMTYAHPSISLAIPNLQPKICSSPENRINEWHDRIMLVSTWNINCGIALYTKDLLTEFEKMINGAFIIRNIESSNGIGAKLVHLQHEFSIMQRPPIVGGKVIITWHSIIPDISNTIKNFESNLEVVAHIIPCEGAREYMHTSKDVYVVNLGSKLMPNISKEDARKFLGIDTEKPIGFVFGFQSPNKNYSQLIEAAKNTNICIIISGSTHFTGYKSNISNCDNVIFLNRYLTEDEIDLYALASDILLFDYSSQIHYSSSSALHRTIGAGRPVICSDTRHFNDISNSIATKFNDNKQLEDSIRFALENKESLGKECIQYAINTSWDKIARQHIDIYKKYVSI